MEWKVVYYVSVGGSLPMPRKVGLMIDFAEYLCNMQGLGSRHSLVIL